MIVTDHISPYFTTRDWDGLTRHLSRLSNADFRKAESIVREELLPTLPPTDFWTAMRHLVSYRKAAFITGLKALGGHTQARNSTLLCDESRTFAGIMLSQCPEAVPKAINIVLPLLATERQIDELFTLFAIDDTQQRVIHLVKVESPLTYFALFKTLKLLPDNSPLVRQCCQHIMSRANDQAINMAGIIRTYFDIPDINIPHSIKLDTYELSYLDRDINTFMHFLNGRRPKV